MSLILNIETATKNCSVSLAKNGECIDILEQNDGGFSHAEKLHLFIKQILDKNNLTTNHLDAIAVSKGPGSYTGLRIGVSAAKGICYAANKPLISVNTLESLAKQTHIEKGYIIPMIDARRMEVYNCVVDADYRLIQNTTATIIDENSFSDLLEKDTIYFIGDGAEKCKPVITHKNAHFINEAFPSAKEMCAISYEKHINSDYEDVAYFEPFYLKDFVVTPEKKKPLGNPNKIQKNVKPRAQ